MISLEAVFWGGLAGTKVAEYLLNQEYEYIRHKYSTEYQQIDERIIEQHIPKISAKAQLIETLITEGVNEGLITLKLTGKYNRKEIKELETKISSMFFENEKICIYFDILIKSIDLKSKQIAKNAVKLYIGEMLKNIIDT